MYIRPDNAQNIGAREKQEDSFGFSSFDQKEIVDNRGFVAVLADGMGGLSHGREASQLAVQAFIGYYSNLFHENRIPSLLHNALLHANENVQHFAHEKGIQNQVGSTLIAAAVKDGHLFWISVGDSHIYLFRANELIQLTVDHVYANVLNEEAAMGKITKEEAENHPQKGALTSFLGLEELVEIDQNFEPFPLQPGDRVLLCSDGLYGFIEKEEIIQVLKESQSEVCEALIQKVLQKKHPFQDNITTILLDFKDDDIQSERIEMPTVVTESETETLSRTNPSLKKRWYLTLFIPIILVIFLIGGIIAGYVFLFKDGNFQDIKNKVTNLFHFKEQPHKKQSKEGEKKQ